MLDSLNTIKWKARTYQKILGERIFDWQKGENPNVQDVDSEAINSLKKNGFALIEDFFDSDLCDKIISEIDQCVEKHQQFVWSDDQDSDHRLFGIENLSPLIHEHFFASKRLQQIGESYLGYKLKNYMTLAGNLKFKKNNLGSGGGWHRDSAFSNQFKAIVYLTDVSEKNGVYEYIPKSHSTSNVLRALNVCLKNSESNPSDINRRFNENEVIDLGIAPRIFEAKRGTVILTDTHGIHRGRPIVAGTRYALTNYYVGSHRVAEFDQAFQDLNLPN
ncbi:phytanoyl-CoA dioxygenase family protein [Ekhidna sp.]